MTRKSGNQKRTTCPRRMIVFFFFFITVFLNLHPSLGFPSTGLRHHSALILEHSTLCTLSKVLWAGVNSTHQVSCLFLSCSWGRTSWTYVLAEFLVRETWQVYHHLGSCSAPDLDEALLFPYLVPIALLAWCHKLLCRWESWPSERAREPPQDSLLLSSDAGTGCSCFPTSCYRFFHC